MSSLKRIALRTALIPICLIAFWSHPIRAQGRIEAHVDRRIELISIMCHLAEYDEYRSASAHAYSDAIEKRFTKYRNHPSIRLLRDIRQKHGLSHEGPIQIALLSDPDNLRARLRPDASSMGESPLRWGDAQTGRALQKAIAVFQRDSHANDFFRENQTLFRLLDAEASKLSGQLDIAWFNREFGDKANSHFILIPTTLTDGNNYGATVHLPDGGTEIYIVLGGVFGESEKTTVASLPQASVAIHEIAHSFINPWVDTHAARIEIGARHLFSATERDMRAIAYGTWRIMVYESLVRSTVRRYLEDHGETDQLLGNLQEDHDRGFAWLDGLTDLLRTEKNASAPRFAAASEAVLRYFESWGSGAEDPVAAVRERLKREQLEKQEKGPQIVMLSPANGSSGVDPSLTSLEIRFDRPMAAGFSFVNRRADFPDVKPTWDQSRHILRIPIELKPATAYKTSLNSYIYQNFKSAEGEALVPREWTFNTR